jgi:multiple sugar transport system ATP-binding protein
MVTLVFSLRDMKGFGLVYGKDNDKGRMKVAHGMHTAPSLVYILVKNGQDMASVELNALSKKYAGGVDAVRDISLQVSDGEFVVLVGPSGCGKSTVLRMVAGLEEVTEGEIRIGDKVVNHMAPRDRNVSMVFQNYALYPHMTVAQNIGFGLSLRGHKKADIRRIVGESASMLGLEQELDRRPGELSGGQRQRVALGRAIVRKPEVFLFDEPLSNLDARLRANMRLEIAKLHKRLGTTMMYVTHDQVEAMTMGTRIVVMNEGKILQVDTPLNVYRSPATTFVATFIGSPPMNLLAASVVAQPNPQLVLTDLDVTFPLEGSNLSHLAGHMGKDIIVGIRPEGLVQGAQEGKSDAGGTAENQTGRGLGKTGALSLELEVDLAEPLGNETILHLKRNGFMVIVRSGAGHVPESGSVARFSFDLEAASLFDASSGVRLP